MIYLEKTAATPLYLQLYQEIRKEILSGAISMGSTLPSIRKLSKDLAVSKNTVISAYDQLLAEGYIKSRRGSGFEVESFPEMLPSDNIAAITKDPVIPKKVQTKEPPSPVCPYDFQYGNLPPGSFPLNAWRKTTMQIMNGTSDLFAAYPGLLEAFHSGLSSYPDIQGVMVLRTELCSYLRKTRGVVCRPEQIVMASGLQNALRILCRVLPKENQAIGFENPGYPGARIVFEQAGFPILPIASDSNEAFLKDISDLNPGTIYVTPSHQFPLGTVMPIGVRMELIRWASDHGKYIIEDDYDSEYRYRTMPIPSLSSIDTTGRVIYVGTFSKALSPSLRLSYFVLPEELLIKYQEAMEGCYSSMSYLDQMVLAAFFQNGEWERCLHRMRRERENCHDALISALNTTFGSKIEIIDGSAGLHILARFPSELSQEVLLQKAESQGVRLYPITSCFIPPKNPPKNLFLIGFSGLQEDVIIEGIRRLGIAWKSA